MSKIAIEHPDKSVNTGHYFAAILIDRWLFISGQGPLNLATGAVMHRTIEEETLDTLSHIKKIVEAACGSIDDIVKCMVHLADINEFDRYIAVYASFFLGNKPARTTVQSGLSDGIKIEIDAIAKLKSKNYRNKS